MGFWNILGKVAGIAGAPFTGGASLIPTLVGTGLDVAGKIAQGKAKGRAADAEANLSQDQLRRQASLDAMQAQLANRQLPGLRASNSVRGDILANVQPVTREGSGRDLKFSGGLGPALLSDNSRQIGQEMSREALLSALGKGGPSDNYAQLKPSFAGPTPLPQASGLDKVLGGLGIGGGMLRALQEAQQQQDEDDSWMLGPHA